MIFIKFYTTRFQMAFYYIVMFSVVSFVSAENMCDEISFRATELQVCNPEGKCKFFEVDGCASPDTVSSDAYNLKVLKKLDLLKSGAIQNLPMVEEIHINKRGLKEIYANSLINLPLLRLFFAANNELKIIRSGVFNNSNVKNINLENNQIETIEEGAFSDIAELAYLSLSNNLLKTVDSNWFRGTEKIYTLELSENRITTIKSNTFKNFRNIDHISLSYNRIEMLEPNSFEGLNLTILDLFSNRLKELNLIDIGRKTKISSLYIGMNQLTYLSRAFVTSGMVTYNIGLHPNPWSCTCLHIIEKLMGELVNKIQPDFYLYPYKWNENVPLCIMQKKARICDYEFATAESDSIKEYFSIVDYECIKRSLKFVTNTYVFPQKEVDVNCTDKTLTDRIFGPGTHTYLEDKYIPFGDDTYIPLQE